MSIQNSFTPFGTDERFASRRFPELRDELQDGVRPAAEAVHDCREVSVERCRTQTAFGASDIECKILIINKGSFECNSFKYK